MRSNACTAKSLISSPRELMLSLRNTPLRWNSTVFGLRKSRAATSRFVMPSATRIAIWNCCGVKRSAAVGVTPVDALAGRSQFNSGALGPRSRLETLECLECRAELLARKLSLPRPAEALAVAELGPGTLERARVPLVQLQRRL